MGIDQVVNVVYKYKGRRVGHIAVAGRIGFQLCTCLELLICGLPCRYMFAVLVTELNRGDDFIGSFIHP